MTASRYFIEQDGFCEETLWRESEGAEHRPQPVLRRDQVNDAEVWEALHAWTLERGAA